MDSSWLIDCIRRQLPEGAPPPEPGPLRRALAEHLTDPRRPRGIRHSLASLILVLVTGVACGHDGPLAIAGAAARWDQDVLAAHGCRRNPRTGALEPPSASTLGRLPRHLDAVEFEAGLSGCLAAAALDPQVTACLAARRAAAAKEGEEKGKKKKRRKPPAAEALRQVRDDGWFRAAPGHPWLDSGVTSGPGHVPGRPAVAVDGKERKLAKAGGKKKVHLLAAVTHVLGAVIGQDKVARSGKANEVTHFRPLLEPLPLAGVLVTADAMQTTRDNARFLREVKDAHYLWPILGNQPGQFAALDALDWGNTPVAAATAEISHGRIETRTIRVLPMPEGTGFPGAEQAILIERYVTVKKNGHWQMRNCEAVFYITSLTAAETTSEDLLAFVRGHWTVEHTHWLRDVIWKEDQSLLRTGNAPWVMSAITNLVITLFRIHGVTRYKEETRRNAQDPRRTLRLLGLSPG